MAYVVPDKSQQEEKQMSAPGNRKCAYTSCQCVVYEPQRYCSDYCSDADDVKETEIQCDCKHSPCELD